MKKHAPKDVKNDKGVTPANLIISIRSDPSLDGKTESEISTKLQSIVDSTFK